MKTNFQTKFKNFGGSGVQTVAAFAIPEDTTERVTNGTFGTDSDWEKFGGATIESGHAILPGDGASIRQASIAVERGVLYTFGFKTNGEVAHVVRENDVSGRVLSNSIEYEDFEVDILPDADILWLVIAGREGSTVNIDDVSIKASSHIGEVTPTHLDIEVTNEDEIAEPYIKLLAGDLPQGRKICVHSITDGFANLTVDQVGADVRYPYTPSARWFTKSSVGWIPTTSEFARLAYGEIHVHDASTAQSIANGTTYIKLTAFTSNGLYLHCTPDAANNKITITEPGVYQVNGAFNYTSGTNNVIFRIAAFLAGAEQDHIHCYDKKLTGTDACSHSFTGIINVTTPSDLDVRIRHDNGGAVNLTMVYANLNIVKIS